MILRSFVGIDRDVFFFCPKQETSTQLNLKVKFTRISHLPLVVYPSIYSLCLMCTGSEISALTPIEWTWMYFSLCCCET